jgi:hypothetical protein
LEPGLKEVLAMAEVGAVKFARVAYEVASVVLPAYRSKFSKHTFTQPQLLAALLVMRYEDWTFREAEVRLLEHSELRAALGLSRVPDYTALYRFMRRLDKDAVDRALAEAARLVPPPPSGGAGIAVDGTGLEATSVSAYYVQRSGSGPRRRYMKLVVSVDIRRLVITSQLAHEGPTNDTASLPALVEGARRLGPVSLVLADAEFDSGQNHDYVRNEVHAMSIIPATRSKEGRTAHPVRKQMKEAFPHEVYGKRWLVETVFSMMKRKLSRRAPGRSTETRAMQALLLGLAFNIYRLKLWLFTSRYHRHLAFTHASH